MLLLFCSHYMLASHHSFIHFWLDIHGNSFIQKQQQQQNLFFFLLNEKFNFKNNSNKRDIGQMRVCVCDQHSKNDNRIKFQTKIFYIEKYHNSETTTTLMMNISFIIFFLFFSSFCFVDNITYSNHGLSINKFFFWIVRK